MSTNKEIATQWAALGWELAPTGGGFWAAFKTVDGVQFMATNDQDESLLPDPSSALALGAYDPDSGDPLPAEIVEFPSIKELEQEIPSILAGFRAKPASAPSMS